MITEIKGSDLPLEANMRKSKQIQNMYFRLLNDKLYEIWSLKQWERESSEMIKQFGRERLFNKSIEYDRNKRKELTEEAKELYQAWRGSL